MGRRFTSLADEEFNRLFSEFQYTAYRLETLQSYDVSYERDAFGRFEERGFFPGIEDWIDNTVARAVAAGKTMHRVHVVEEPPSDYVRFECAWAYEHTVAAGEAVRILPIRAGQWPEPLPRQDYWLFDSRMLVAMHYRRDGSFESAEIIDDPAEVVRANHWRDAAVAMSVPYRTYAERGDRHLAART